MFQEIEFAPDSPLEEARFEPSVPRDSDDGFRLNSPAPLLSESEPRSESALLHQQNVPYQYGAGDSRPSQGKTRPRRLVVSNLTSALTGSRRAG
jgi:hypothetical protein